MSAPYIALEAVAVAVVLGLRLRVCRRHQWWEKPGARALHMIQRDRR